MRKGFLACLLALEACGPAQRSARTTSAPQSNGTVQASPSLSADEGAGASSPPQHAPPQKVGGSFRADIAFSKFAKEKKDLSATDLDKELGIGPSADRPLTFDPTTIRYFKEVAEALSLSTEEKKIFGKQGVVVVDHVQRYGMSSAYHAIYTRDLPVLVTTDSILHALHRSYDDILKALEVTVFSATIKQTLETTTEELANRSRTLDGGLLQDNARDVDVYLTVALNLLEGAGAEGQPQQIVVRSKLGTEARVQEQLKNVASLEQRGTELNGARLAVDYSQFKPRGHYTESDALKRYFRAMMWLGRADTGFVLGPPQPGSGINADSDRGIRDASLLALLVRESGTMKGLDAMAGVIDFLVGRADNLRLDQLAHALAKAGVDRTEKLAKPEVLSAIRADIASAGDQQIRSQILANADETKETMPPSAFQLFGQRFLIDSFVLSKVVYDSILYKGVKQERLLPSGRDVMAALGNDEAVRLLKPDLERFKYATNLYAARKTVDSYPEEDWHGNVYGLWLQALRTLDDVPSKGHFPETMRREAWRRKHLETQLASWAELRHDTILYGKQSYSTSLCEYPEGFVEPYPEFFARLRELAETASRKLEAIELPAPDKAPTVEFLRRRAVDHFRDFGEIMQYLELLARKELDAKPFTADEVGFLKKTIDVRGGGSGGPTYSGWYPGLLFDEEPMKTKPVVADVHTADGAVLEEGVGDVNFLVVAVDNQKDRAVYVGPAYSYYEFTSNASNRLTDEQWMARIEQAELPPRPAWTAAFRGKPAKRNLPRPSNVPERHDPREVRVQKQIEQLYKQMGKGADNRSIAEEIGRLGAELRHPPLPPAAKPK